MKILIGVMGPGEKASPHTCQLAYTLGQLIAREGWGLLTGGRDAGVMAAASRGARSAGGLTVGILPDDYWESMADSIDIPILTDLGNARNNINVLSSRVVVACGIGMGTLSEVALALKAGRPVILLAVDPHLLALLQPLTATPIHQVDGPEAAIPLIWSHLQG